MSHPRWQFPKANLRQAEKLFHEGAIALSQIESNGIKVDVDYLEKAIQKGEEEVRVKRKALRKTKVYKKWKKVYGEKTNIGSKDQLAHIVFDVLGYPVERRTDKGRPAADEEAFEKIDDPFVQAYFDLAHLEKAINSFLRGLRREVTHDHFVHPTFNLNTVQTYRSSCTDPNIMQQPKRNRTISEIVRQCYIPRHPSRMFGEGDLGQIEVRMAAVYSLDPKLLAYVKDEKKDMHRDMAARCYMLKHEWVSKQTRHAGKNMFVFPEFYGDYYINIAKAMWDEIRLSDLHYIKDEKKIGLRQHLKRKGIDQLGKCDSKSRPEPGTFEHHIWTEERYFWDVLFPVYASWKKEWYRRYLERGEMAMFTGFQCLGAILSFNQAVNYPIQGASFHFLLAVLIELQKWLNKYKMRTLLLGEIHDSLMFDAAKHELQDLLWKIYELMTVMIPKKWPWICVPITAELEVAPPGMSWFNIQQWIPNEAGIWGPK